MEINSPEDFRDQPVIDIEVEFVGGVQNAWTINDEPDNQPRVLNQSLGFQFLTTFVAVELRNVLWWGLRRRIDRIPVKKEQGTSAPSRPPEGGVTGDE